MSNVKHTPGPWHREDGESDFQMVTDDHGEAVCYLFDEKFDGKQVLLQGIEPDRANADLIASAPDLLEACELALQYIGDGTGEYALSALEDAITKAKGENL
jgi:hypothetical protein